MTPADETWSDFKEVVYEIVEKDGPMTTDDVIDQIDGAYPNDVYGALKHLNWDDRIVREGSDTWYVEEE